MTELLVGIDVGTSSIKAAALDAEGRVRGSASLPTPWRATPSGVEADADAIADVARRVMHEATGDSGDAVAAVGVTGMAESGVMLDDAGDPLAPIIAWHDARGDDAEAELLSLIDPGEFAQRSGQPLTRKLSAVKFKWLRDQLGRRALGARWLNVPEWVVHRLGGGPAPELSLGSRSGFVEIATGRWYAEVAQWAGMGFDRLPEPTPAGTPSGRVTAAGPGDPATGAILTVAGHDHLCAAVGADATAAGDVFDSWGNGEGVLRRLEALPEVPLHELNRDGTTVSWHPGGPRYALVRGLRSGLILRRTLALLGIDERRRGDLDRAAAELAPDAGRPRLRVSASGELDTSSVPADAEAAVVWRAALDLVFARVRAAVRAYEPLCGPTARIVGAGGWLRSRPLLELKRAAIPGFEVSAVDEAGVIGAARLAAAAAGIAPISALGASL